VSISADAPSLIETCICYCNSRNEYDITITRFSSPTGTVNVFVSAPSVPLGHICVNSVGTNHTVILHVGLSASRVGSIRSIRDTGTGTVQLAEAWTTGHIGQGVSPGDFAIEVDVVVTVEASGDLLGSIKATDGGVATVRAASVLANVFAEGVSGTGTIGVIDAVQQIGSTTNTVQILSRNDTGTIVADRIYADVNTRAGTGGNGNLTLLRTRSGSSGNIFRGSLVTTSVVGTVTNHGIQVFGELDADITVHQDVTRPIIVSGQLNSGRTLTIAGSMLTSGSSTGRLEIGTLAGSALFTSNSVGPQGNITCGAVASTGQLRIHRGFPSGYTISTTSGPMAGWPAPRNLIQQL
jgi:hypothetical protein